MPCYNASCPIPMEGTASTTFAAAVQFFAAAQYLLTEGILPEADVRNCETFDFIIVGAGSSGCVLANRLSEIEDWNVLVIEAGGDPPIESTVPGLSTNLWTGKYTWGYQTSDDGITNQGNRGGSIPWSAGKVIGGSSNINAMVYAQGNDHDYLQWNNSDWTLKDIRRCFRKAENFQDKNLNKYPKIYKHYGHHGPLVINTLNCTDQYESQNMLSAFDEIGIKNVLDMNVANSLGSGTWRVTGSNNERNSISKAYLKPVKHRANLKIMKNTLVTKILIDSSKKAFGVVVEQNCKKITIYANKEVIISAGSSNSPKLLMLSGIGPKLHLSSKNIPTLIDSPMVGQNLKSHCIVPITIYADELNTISEADQHFDIMKYYYNRSGNLAHNIYHDMFAFYSIDEGATYPDFQTYVLKFTKGTSGLKDLLIRYNNYKDVVVESIVELNKKYSLYNIGISQLHAHSSGNITLSSNNPKDPPIIYANYFQDSKDLERMVSGIKIMLNILNTTYFKSVNGFLGRMKYPKCDKFKLSSDNYWKCVSISLVGSVFHGVGTCKMGSSLKNSVVNSRLKVHGTKNLRVIDASIMPSHISSNTNAACVMIGERAAELIKQDHKRL